MDGYCSTVSICAIGTLRALRKNFAVVLQEVFLFSGTIEGNIRLGREDINEERVRWAAQEVHADSFIRRLKGEYEAEVRERGAGLSVGQKQLISFARALAFDPAILILDEATSSIDTETEQLIQRAIERVMRDRTSIVVAHRLSTIQNATGSSSCITVRFASRERIRSCWRSVVFTGSSTNYSTRFGNDFSHGLTGKDDQTQDLNPFWRCVSVLFAA